MFFFHCLIVTVYFRRKDEKDPELHHKLDEKPRVVPSTINEGYLGPIDSTEVQLNLSAVGADEEDGIPVEEDGILVNKKKTDPSDFAADKNIYDNQKGKIVFKSKSSQVRKGRDCSLSL